MPNDERLSLDNNYMQINNISLYQIGDFYHYIESNVQKDTRTPTYVVADLKELLDKYKHLESNQPNLWLKSVDNDVFCGRY